MKQLKLAHGIKISDLNPHNFALKNDYMNNIISCGLILTDCISKCGFKNSVNIVKGFLSNSYIADNLAVSAGKCIDFLMQHSRGNAIEITFDDFTVDKAIDFSKDMLYSARDNDEICRCIIYSGRESIGIYFEEKEYGIEIITNNNEKRVVFKI